MKTLFQFLLVVSVFMVIKSFCNGDISEKFLAVSTCLLSILGLLLVASQIATDRLQQK